MAKKNGKFSGMMKTASKAVKAKLMIILTPFIFKFVLGVTAIIMITGIIYPAIQWVSEHLYSQNNPTVLYNSLSIEKLADLVEIKGNEQSGYYLGFKENIDTKLEAVAKYYRMKSGVATADVNILKKFIQAELVTQFPNLGGQVGNNADSNTNGLGTKQDIPSEIQEQMKNVSLPEVATISYDSLSYLTIPYYDFNGIVQDGHMIVNKQLADEVLQIFKELYDIQYPIEKMRIIDNYYDGNDPSKLDYDSIDDNNTSSFCYRQATAGSNLSQHAFGNAIDINPQINPYVSNGSFSHQNAEKYVSRNTDSLNETERAALITTNSEIYEIFHKYGWTWGGDWDDPKDYQHFEKTDFSEIYVNENRNDQQTSSPTVTASNDAFHGAIRIRRVTPNKELGEVKDTSAGTKIVTSNMEGEALGEIQNYLSSNGAEGTWSIYAKNIKTGKETVSMNNKKMQSASLIKLFIMATAYQEIENGVDINKNDIEKMITVSDNDATNRLIDQLGFTKIQKYISDNEYRLTEINRKMLASSANGDNYTCVGDVATILEKIVKGECVSESASNEMLNYLKNQQRTEKIPAGVPDGVVTANKTGELDTVENDAAIVYKENANYLLVVMSSDLTDTAKARENIKQISSIVYNTMPSDSNSSSSGSSQNSSGKHVIAVDAGHGIQEHAGGYDDLAQNESEIATKKWYTTGTSGETPSGETWTEWQTVQKVVDYVKQLISPYSDQVEIVQTGKDQPNIKRMQLAKDAGAEAYIGVHLNSNDSSSANGTNIYYLRGNGNQESVDFGSIFLDSVSANLGLAKGSVQAGDYGGLGLYQDWQIPSIYVEGAFMSSPKDMEVIGAEGEEGLQKYAKGIVDGILEYCGIENRGYGQSTSLVSQSETQSTTVNSKIYDMKYITPEKFDQMIEDKDKDVLKYYTLDPENWNLVTAKWQYTDGELSFSKNSAINFRTQMQKYTTPFEYLMNYYIDLKDKDFMSDFADLAINSEYILAVQDNVSTTKVTTTKDTWYEKNGVTSNYSSNVESSKLTETVQVEIELTYADTWFVRFEKDSSYSSANITSANSTLSGEQGDYLGDYFVTAYCATCNSPPGSLATASGKDATPNHTIAVHTEEFTNPSSPLYKGSNVMINGQIYTVEDTGDLNHRWGDKWIDVFVQASEDGTDSACINSGLTREIAVYSANNVTQSSNQQTVRQSALMNATANVIGTVKDGSKEEIIDSGRAKETDGDGYNCYQTKQKVEAYAVQYKTGESHVTANETRFISLFDQHPKAKASLKPEWLASITYRNQKTSNMTDLTKYLLNCLLNKEIFKDIDKDKIFSKYEDNEFKSISRSGKMSYETLSITQADREILYKITSAERNNGTQEQQEYVVSVILNRVLASSHPNTVRGVVFETNQFQPTRNGAYDRAVPSEVTKAAVDNVIENGGTAKTALYFMTPAASLTQPFLADCIFLFNDEDDSLKDTTDSRTHNYYTTAEAEEELKQYMTSVSGGEFLEIAEYIHDYMENNGYAYCLLGGENDPSHAGYGGSHGLNSTFEESQNGHHLTCCATFVSWVLYDYGYTDFAGIHSCAGLYPILSSYADRIDNPTYETMEPGDILFWPGWSHVQIYAGDGTWYNAGGNSSIQNKNSPYPDNVDLSNKFVMRLRN